MSDLISRSELLKRFLVNKDGHRIPERDCDNFEVTISIKDVKAIIKEQPTAYELDKVVEKLEEQMNTYLRLHKEEEAKNGYTNKSQILYDKACSFEDAINIVKRGGVSDDACEWKLTDTRNVMPYKTSCGNEDLYDNSYKYCPYCGKKIKVVE